MKTTKKEIIKINDISEIESNEDLKGYFKNIFETGNVGGSSYFYFDYQSSSYVFIDIETGERILLNATSAKHKLFEIFYKNGVELQNPEASLKYIKKVFVDFDFKKEKSWTTPLGDYFNEFIENKTRLKQIKEERDKGKIESDSCLLKKQAPHIFALLMNLMEEDCKAVDHFINWFASFIHTREKIRNCFLFVGEIEGTGKGVLSNDILAPFFSDEYSTTMLGDELKRDFNSILVNKLLVNFNEISSDFHKNDVVTQKLKQLITDDSFTMNQKGRIEYQTKNNFILVMSSNNPHAIRIPQDDRRFNYFHAKKSLAEISDEKFNGLNVSEFVKKIVEEQIIFEKFIANYDYNLERANTLYNTLSKKVSQNTTSSSIDVMFKLIRTKDFEMIKTNIDEISEMVKESSSEEKYSDSYLYFINNMDLYLKNLKTEFEKNVVSNDSLNFLYSIMVEDTKKKSDRTLVKIFNSRLPNTTSISINGKTKRARYIKKMSDAEIVSQDF